MNDRTQMFVELEIFCHHQLKRIEKALEDRHSISLDASVIPANHALGSKKPSLSQLELEEKPWPPRALLRKMAQ